jgi:serine protease Do
MKRWLLFPTIALIAVMIGLVWNASENNRDISDGILTTNTTETQTPDAQLAFAKTEALEHRVNELETQLLQEIQRRQTTPVVPVSIPEEQPETAQAGAVLSDPQEFLNSIPTQELHNLIAASGQLATKAAINNVAPSVVQVQTASLNSDNNNPLGDLFGNPGSGLGSGFFIDFEGEQYVITNHHVINGASTITISPPNGALFNAALVGSDAQLDIAVLRITEAGAESIPAVSLGDSDALEVGDWVTAIGNPFGLDHTVTSGIVSSVYRDIASPTGQGQFRNMIQTDAAINPGNSGGPLVNAKGEVVGINTLIVGQGTGLGFSIPINIAKQVLERLVNTGVVTRSWLGVIIRDVNANSAQYLDAATPTGVWIRNLVLGTPAASSLQVNDIVLSVNGRAVEVWSELLDAIQYQRVGDIVVMEVLRNGTRVSIETGLAIKPPPEELGIFNLNVIGPLLINGIGIVPLENNVDLAAKYNLSSNTGILVADMDPNSLASVVTPDMQQLQLGDLIVGVNGYDIQTSEDWNLRLQEVLQVGELKLLVVRGSAQLEINYAPWGTPQ